MTGAGEQGPQADEVCREATAAGLRHLQKEYMNGRPQGRERPEPVAQVAGSGSLGQKLVQGQVNKS